MSTAAEPASYDPKTVESQAQAFWEARRAFEVDERSDKPKYYCLSMLPYPSGALHMGHALDCTLQDLAVRYHRMKGDPTLWLPGTDHAAIATEVKIVDAMRKEGLTKESLGRKGFLDRAWKWKEEYGGRIVTQQRRMGISCDWSRERFTMDEGCSKAVREVFVRLYEKGLIYRGNRLVKEEHKCGVKRMVCAYHSWAFSLDGVVRHVRDAEDYPQGNPIGKVQL